jgi:hypothetical protein
MERLVINIPDAKSNIVKQVLHSLGVAVPGHDIPVKGNYRKRLLKVSAWSDEDLKPVENSGKSFNDLKAEEW